jgi:hypothetical protein
MRSGPSCAPNACVAVSSTVAQKCSASTVPLTTVLPRPYRLKPYRPPVQQLGVLQPLMLCRSLSLNRASCSNLNRGCAATMYRLYVLLVLP